MRPFGAWEPDISDLNLDTLDVARNVFPGRNSYLPARGLIPFSVEALPGPCKGAWYVLKEANVTDAYFATASQIFRYEADTQTLVDVSRTVGGAYNLPVGDYWSGVQYGDRLIVCQLGDFPQYIDINSGTNFQQLPNAPIGRFVEVMDEKVVIASLSTNSLAVAWSDVNDSETWTPGGGSLAGGQEFPDGGEIMGFFPHARLMLQQMGLRGIISTGDIYSFNFQEIATQKGTRWPYSAIEYGNQVYWLSDDGFYVGNSEQQRNISEKRIAGYFLENCNNARKGQVYGAFDPFQSRIYWAWPTQDTAYNNRIIVYDYALDRFTEIEVDTYVLSRFATSGISLDAFTVPTLDMPDLPSLDSPVYKGGAPIIMAVGPDLMLSTFEGETLPATLEPGTFNFAGGPKRVRMRNVMSYFEGDGVDAVKVRIRKRQRYNDAWISTGLLSQQLSGFYRANADGMFHRVEFTIPAGTAWSHAHGWEPNFIPTTER